MNGELKATLVEAGSNDARVDALARYFEAHDLCFGHGTDNAADEAFWLLRHLQHWDDAAWQAPPDPALTAELVALAERRVAERMPLAYLLGEAWFAGLPFHVDQRVLIPRSPIAELIERCFAPWCALEAGDRVLDIGTGSGCLAIAAAHHCPGIRVDATDVEAQALELAAANAARHGVADRVAFLKADLFPSAGSRYRVIMSNPPYVPAGEIDQLPPEYRHEPVAALVGGPTGLEPAAELLDRAPDHLTPDGVLIVEVGSGADALTQAYPDLPLIWIELERGGEGVFVVAADELRHRAHR
jgi:ribosomal protein L3 glutamine methyltransferase